MSLNTTERSPYLTMLITTSHQHRPHQLSLPTTKMNSKDSLNHQITSQPHPSAVRVVMHIIHALALQSRVYAHVEGGLTDESAGYEGDDCEWCAAGKGADRCGGTDEDGEVEGWDEGGVVGECGGGSGRAG